MSIRFSSYVRASGLFLLAMMAAGSAAAQNRTWVSGVGDDLNPCSRTSPCQTFAGAISKTSASGEIDTLDPAGFGTVTITKAITIDGSMGGAFILGSGTNGVNINISTNTVADVVTLRNISIGAGATGLKGVNIIAARSVFIENCSIFGFQTGIDLQPSAHEITLTVTNTSLQRNTTAGIFVKSSGAFFARLSASHVRLIDNAVGMLVEDNSLVYVSDSTASNNTGTGFQAKSTFGGPAHLDLESCHTSNNGNAGVVSENGGAVVRIGNTMVDHNGGAGIVPLAGGQMLTFGNNHVSANAGGDGSVTGTAGPVM